METHCSHLGYSEVLIWKKGGDYSMRRPPSLSLLPFPPSLISFLSPPLFLFLHLSPLPFSLPSSPTPSHLYISTLILMWYCLYPGLSWGLQLQEEYHSHCVEDPEKLPHTKHVVLLRSSSTLIVLFPYPQCAKHTGALLRVWE